MDSKRPGLFAPPVLPFLALISAFTVAACTTLTPISGSRVKAEASSRLSIVLGPVDSVDDAAAERLAKEHCAQYGETAQLARMVGPSSVHYQCLP